MTVLNKWRIFCETEGTWVYIWLEDGSPAPDDCPNISSHTINVNSISIDEILDTTEITLKEESTKTQGNFRTEGFKFDIPASTDYIGSISFPYNINLLAVWFNVKSENLGDQLTVRYQPLYAGALATAITTPTNSINIDHVTCYLLNIGYELLIKRVSDNLVENLGEILAINLTTHTITTTNNTVETFSIGDQIIINVSGVKNLTFASQGRHCIGTSKIGATFIKTGGVFYAYYTNSTPASTKTFEYELEYLY